MSVELDSTLDQTRTNPDIMMDIATPQDMGFAEVFEHLSQASQMILDEIAGNTYCIQYVFSRTFHSFSACQ